MISSPHIIMAVGVILVILFVCIAHRISMHKDMLRRERQLIELTERSAYASAHGRNFPLPDDQFLVITHNRHGHEQRTLISGPPGYSDATAVPPAYVPKPDHPREMEEAHMT
jgi:hypothetical protein